MKRIDFEHGTVTGNIFGAALPMLVAQILSLLYNIVDRVYIARIPEVGTAALGAVGLCFPLIVIITAFSNLFGSGGAPLFSIERGKNDQKKAERIMNTSLFHGMCLCCHTDGDRLFVCSSTAVAVRCIGRCDGIRVSLYDDLSDRNFAVDGGNRHEPVHQRAGLFDRWHAFRHDRSGRKPAA